MLGRAVYKLLAVLANINPDTDDIYEDSLVDTHYPQRPDRLEDVCQDVCTTGKPETKIVRENIM